MGRKISLQVIFGEHAMKMGISSSPIIDGLGWDEWSPRVGATASVGGGHGVEWRAHAVAARV